MKCLMNFVPQQGKLSHITADDQQSTDVYNVGMEKWL